jgi:hypothetical protein
LRAEIVTIESRSFQRFERQPQRGHLLAKLVV